MFAEAARLVPLVDDVGGNGDTAPLIGTTTLLATCAGDEADIALSGGELLRIAEASRLGRYLGAEV